MRAYTSKVRLEEEVQHTSADIVSAVHHLEAAAAEMEAQLAAAIAPARTPLSLVAASGRSGIVVETTSVSECARRLSDTSR